MSVQVENLEKNMAKLTIEVSAEEFEKQYRMLTLEAEEKSQFQVSVKVKHLVL